MNAKHARNDDRDIVGPAMREIERLQRQNDAGPSRQIQRDWTEPPKGTPGITKTPSAAATTSGTTPPQSGATAAAIIITSR